MKMLQLLELYESATPLSLNEQILLFNTFSAFSWMVSFLSVMVANLYR